jgi:hypothetical protein
MSHKVRQRQPGVDQSHTCYSYCHMAETYLVAVMTTNIFSLSPPTVSLYCASFAQSFALRSLTASPHQIPIYKTVNCAESQPWIHTGKNYIQRKVKME